ncbi:MAG: hypothetical protein P1P84_13450 [Deferrisomatales bacterium]|nr:hypothetical protein [Deferrisomatales bacterium]
MDNVHETLQGLKVGEATVFEGLTVFPLLGGNRREPAYLTLDQALERGSGRVTEVSEGGSVPELRFRNDGEQPVLLVDGEELVGAKQNRTLNLTILVAAETSVVIPVTCVEQGRWAYRSAEFASAKRSHFARARAAKAAQVSTSLRESGSRRADQGQVWEAIEEKLELFQTASPTLAMGEIYEQQRHGIEGYLQGLPTVDGQVGAVFAVNGEVSGVDLFDCSATLAALWPKLVSSYAMDALGTGGRYGDAPDPDAPRKATAAFLDAVSAAKVERFPALGLGEDLRLQASGVAGGALQVDGRVVHLSAFRVDGNGGRERTRRPHMASASRRRATRH